MNSLSLTNMTRCYQKKAKRCKEVIVKLVLTLLNFLVLLFKLSPVYFD